MRRLTSKLKNHRRKSVHLNLTLWNLSKLRQWLVVLDSHSAKVAAAAITLANWFLSILPASDTGRPHSAAKSGKLIWSAAASWLVSSMRALLRSSAFFLMEELSALLSHDVTWAPLGPVGALVPKTRLRPLQVQRSVAVVGLSCGLAGDNCDG